MSAGKPASPARAGRQGSICGVTALANGDGHSRRTAPCIWTLGGPAETPSIRAEIPWPAAGREASRSDNVRPRRPEGPSRGVSFFSPLFLDKQEKGLARRAGRSLLMAPCKQACETIYQRVFVCSE